MRNHPALLSVLLLVAAAPSMSSAQAFDLIYSDRVLVSLCPQCGITLDGEDFALLVNTGAAPITQAQLEMITFTSESSRPEVKLVPFINFDPFLGSPPLGPLASNVALGSVGTGNSVLLSRLLPEEVHRNTAPTQVLAFAFDRVDVNSYEGPVRFHVTMTMVGMTATFDIDADMQLGEGGSITFPSAGRVSAVPTITPTREVSWGRLKAFYR